MDRSRILILDDDDQTRDYFRDFLESQEYEVHDASNTPDALEALEAQQTAKEPFDILILDYFVDVPFDNMMACIREIAPELPIILVTGKKPKDFDAIRTQWGIRGHLLKPLEDPMTLKSLIVATIGR
jgi:CheY-like chemotaxis protein